MDRYITTQQAAEHLKKSEATIRTWVSANKLRPCGKLPNSKANVFDRLEVERMITSELRTGDRVFEKIDIDVFLSGKPYDEYLHAPTVRVTCRSMWPHQNFDFAKSSNEEFLLHLTAPHVFSSKHRFWQDVNEGMEIYVTEFENHPRTLTKLKPCGYAGLVGGPTRHQYYVVPVDLIFGVYSCKTYYNKSYGFQSDGFVVVLEDEAVEGMCCIINNEGQND